MSGGSVIVHAAGDVGALHRGHSAVPAAGDSPAMDACALAIAIEAWKRLEKVDGIGEDDLCRQLSIGFLQRHPPGSLAVARRNRDRIVVIRDQPAHERRASKAEDFDRSSRKRNLRDRIGTISENKAHVLKDRQSRLEIHVIERLVAALKADVERISVLIRLRRNPKLDHVGRAELPQLDLQPDLADLFVLRPPVVARA